MARTDQGSGDHAGSSRVLPGLPSSEGHGCDSCPSPHSGVEHPFLLRAPTVTWMRLPWGKGVGPTFQAVL